MYIFIRLFLLTLTALSISLHTVAQNSNFQVREDLVYKTVNGQDLKLDIYRLDSTGVPNPVIVYIHGGVWVFGDKSNIIRGDRLNVLNELVLNGFAVVSIDYRLIDEDSTHFPAPIKDCKDAVKWIKKHATEFNLDAEDIGVWGNSAGAHLAMLTAFSSNETDKNSDEQTVYTSTVNYVIDFYGASDLTEMFKLDVSNTSLFFLKILKRRLYYIRQSILYKMTGFNPFHEKDSVVAVCALYSPVNYVNENTVPVLIIQGMKDKVVPSSQSEILDNALTAHGVYHQLLLIEHGEHVFDPLKKDDSELISKTILDFLKVRKMHSLKKQD